jgi:D-alanine-D-alanine ligase
MDCVGSNVGSEIESLASQTSSAALQLRSAQNDSGLRIGHEKEAKVLGLFDGTSPTTVDQDFSDELKTKEWKTEADVMNALGTLGHTPEHLAIYDDVDLLRQKLETFAPDVLFNLVEQFRNKSEFDQNIVSFFEMQGLPFTGCGSTGLTLCKHKGHLKKDSALSRHSRAEFHGHSARAADRALKQPKFPLIVKPVKEEASYGISQASFVGNDEQFRERVTFIHEKHNSDVIAENTSRVGSFT